MVDLVAACAVLLFLSLVGLGVFRAARRPDPESQQWTDAMELMLTLRAVDDLEAILPANIRTSIDTYINTYRHGAKQ